MLGRKLEEPQGKCVTRGCSAPIAWLIVKPNGEPYMKWCAEHYDAFGKDRQIMGTKHMSKEEYDNRGTSVGTTDAAGENERERAGNQHPPADGESTESEPRRLRERSLPAEPAVSRGRGIEVRDYRPPHDVAAVETPAVAPIPALPSIAVYQAGGVTRFTKEQEAILRQPVNPELVEVKYDGAVYMPGAWYRKVLNDAFGPGGWQLHMLRGPDKDGKDWAAECVLIAEGRVIARTFAEYKANQYNEPPSRGTIFESLCTDGITKCAKTLGVAEELWFPSFTRKWLSEYAEEYYDRNNKKRYRRKDEFMGHDAIKPGYGHMSEYYRQEPLEKANLSHIESIQEEDDSWMDTPTTEEEKG